MKWEFLIIAFFFILAVVAQGRHSHKGRGIASEAPRSEMETMAKSGGY